MTNRLLPAILAIIGISNLGFAQDKQTIFDALFSPEILEVTIETDLTRLIDNRKTDDYQHAIFSFENAAGELEQHDMKLKPRGKFRRTVCDFPPVKLNFSKDRLMERGYIAEYDKLKLVTHCIEDKFASRENVAREYLAYRLYSIVSDKSYRGQLVRINYTDSKNRVSRIKRYGFILEELQGKGYATGLVATATIVHATPAAFAAHQPIRVFYEEIAEDFSASGVDYLVGGGKRYFDRREKDERDLIQEMEDHGYYVTSYLEHELQDLVPSPMNRFCYFAADKHPLTKAAGRDYLPDAVKLGVSYLKRRSDKGFFLMAEGSMIDWGGHANDGALIIEETKDFDRAVKEALNFARRDGETLVVVTADHESGGMALNPGSSFEAINAKFTTNGHTAAMVPVFAYGPGAERFDGIYENTEIYFKMRQALGLPEKEVAQGQ